jgi:hypothetical protein
MEDSYVNVLSIQQYTTNYILWAIILNDWFQTKY